MEQIPEAKEVTEVKETATPAAPVEEPTKTTSVVFPAEKPEDMTEAEWADLEEQRDLAYKIVYFFLMMIIVTFGLLYVYYKMDQKEQMKEARQQREKGAFFGEIAKTTNFDFLG